MHCKAPQAARRTNKVGGDEDQAIQVRVWTIPVWTISKKAETLCKTLIRKNVIVS